MCDMLDLQSKMTTISNHSNLMSPQQQQQQSSQSQQQQQPLPPHTPLSTSGFSPLVNSTSNVSCVTSSSSNSSGGGSSSVNVNRHSDNLALWSHISVNLLHTWIKDDVNSQNNKLLIIDSRDPVDYHTLHIRHAINLFDSAVMRKQLVSDKMSINELLVKYSNIDLINTNLNELNLVVYDHKSEHTNQLDFESEFSVILLRKLVHKYTTSVSFLSGGFKQFHELHPDLCESSSSSTTSMSQSATFENSVDMLNVGLGCNRQVTSQLLTRNDSESKDAFVTEVVGSGPKKPRQLKLSHSLSTYAFDGLTANSAASSLSSPTMLDHEQLMHQSSSPFNSFPLLLIPNKSNSSLSSLGSGTTTTTSANNSASISSSGGGCASSSPKIRQPTKILSYLYLGSEEDASCKVTMNTLGITNVLNVSVNCQKPEFIAEQNFLRIPVNDGPFDKILPFFDQAFNFIENCRKENQKVIIHCLAGISRSPTLAIAYLMKHKNIKSDEAYKFVKERRHTISPSFNFLGQLFEYEKQQTAAAVAKNSLLNEPIKPSAAAVVVADHVITTNTFISAQLSSQHTATTTSAATTPVAPMLNFLNMTKRPSFTNQFQLRSPLHQQQAPLPSTGPPVSSSAFSSLLSSCTPAPSIPSIPAPAPTSANSIANLSQRKKQFVFEFNTFHPSSSSNNNNNNNILIQSPIKSLQLNSPLVLHSPCQALSTFHINSPCATGGTGVDSTMMAAPQHHQQHATPAPKPICKSFTMDSINPTSSNISGTMAATTPTSNVILRRPTNLLLTTTNVSSSSKSIITPSNNLKRPSSILLTTGHLGGGLNKQVITEETATTTANSNITTTTTSSTVVVTKDFNLKSSDSTSGQTTAYCFTRSLSNNSSCSTASTASSNSSCSSTANNNSVLSLPLPPPPLLTTSVLPAQQQHGFNISSQKKLKLSPIQDNFYKNLFPSGTSGAESGILTRSLFDRDDDDDDHHHHDNQDDEMIDTSQNINCTVATSANNHSKPTTPLTPTSVLNTDNLVTCFNQKLNESNSIDNLKLTTAAAASRSNIIDDCSNAENISEQSFAASAFAAKQQSKITNSASLNSINLANSSSSGGGNTGNTKSSSSNSSSKPGSNKNSLHGSVETMIQVS